MRRPEGAGDGTATTHRVPAPVAGRTVPGRSGEGGQLGTGGGSARTAAETETRATGKPGEGHLGKPRESSELSREPEFRQRGCGPPQPTSFRLLIAGHCGPRATHASRGRQQLSVSRSKRDPSGRGLPSEGAGVSEPAARPDVPRTLTHAQTCRVDVRGCRPLGRGGQQASKIMMGGQTHGPKPKTDCRRVPQSGTLPLPQQSEGQGRRRGVRPPEGPGNAKGSLGSATR